MIIIYMLKFLFFILMIANPIYTFNISNLNQLSKQIIFDKLSSIAKVSAYYTLNSKNLVNEDKYELQEKPDKTSLLENSVYFYSEVNEKTSLMLENNLLSMNHRNLIYKEKYNIDNGPIHLHIQSYGGSLFHTIYLIDLIQNLESDVYTYVDGFAASAATLISVAGKKRFMTKNSLMLIHQLSGGVSGKYSEMKDDSENNDLLMSIIYNLYMERTKMNRQQLETILGRDIWLNSTRCLQYGLVDEIV